MDDSIIRQLKNGFVGIVPTDTIYGLVGSALNPSTVERIYHLKDRDSCKPMIILIGSINDLKIFGINLDLKTKSILQKYWPGPTSIILPCEGRQFEYLHRGTKSLAIRIPRKNNLRKFLVATGPLVAPSANIEGKSPAKTIADARSYFGNQVDFYVDGKTLNGRPSTLIKLVNNKKIVLRK